MADQGYEKKLESLRRYIPFLVNMMSELKAKGNREAQLNKIQSLHDMITDSRKKLKLETLNRCEEVLTNIYFKVNPQLKTKTPNLKTLPADGILSTSTLPGIESPRSTPASPSPTRDVVLIAPVTIPTEKVDKPGTGLSSLSVKKSHLPKIDVYSNVVINKPSKDNLGAKVPDMSKPPISLDDLKTLEDDVQQKISDATYANASVDDLQAYRKEIELQLRIDTVTAAMSPEKSKEDINTTVRNNPTMARKISFTEDKSKTEESSKGSRNPTSPIKEVKAPTEPKKTHKDKEESSPKALNKSISKTLTDSSSMFGNLLSSIDSKILDDKKKSKKHDRRSSLTLSKDEDGSTTSLGSDRSENKETDSNYKKDHSKDRKSSESRKERRSSIDKDKSKHKHRDKSKDKKDTGESSHKKDKKSKKRKKKSKEHGEKDKSRKNSSKDDDSHKSEKEPKVKEKGDVILLSDILLSNSKACLESNKNSTAASATKETPKLENKLDNVTVPSKIVTVDSSETKTILETVTDKTTQQSTTVFKRLADKYNPKPKPKTDKSDAPEVDKAVADSIENLMKTSPAKPLASPLGEPKPLLGEKVAGPATPRPVASMPMPEPSKTSQLPDILQKIFSKPLLGDIIPKRLNENAFQPPSVTQNRTPNFNLQMTKPGAIQPPEPPILSPPHRSLHFQPPEPPRSFPNFVSPPHRPEIIPNNDIGVRQIPLLPTPSLQHGILPTPPIPPDLPIPMGFNDHNAMTDMGYATPRMNFDTPATPRMNFDAPSTPRMNFDTPATPRMDFDTPATPMADFDSPRLDFEHPNHLRNEQFNMNPMYMPQMHQEHQPQGFDPIHQNYMTSSQFPLQPEMNMYNNQMLPGMGYYATNNQMPMLTPEVPAYMPEQKYYQERGWHENTRWGRDRRPGDPRSYREYKEMKEREAKAAQEKPKEIKDPRLAPRDSIDAGGEKDVVVRDPRLLRESVDRSLDRSIDRSDIVIRDPRLARGIEKSVDRDRTVDLPVEQDIGGDFRRNDGRESRNFRAKSRDRDFRDRGRSRERALSRTRELPDPRESRSRPRERDTRFDKMYSRTNRAQSQSRSETRDYKEEEDESFTSPLDSLYNAGEKGRTGRGYGVQKFKIPKKVRKEDSRRRDERKEEDRKEEERPNKNARKKRYIVASDESDDSDKNDVDNSVHDNDSDIEFVEESTSDKGKVDDKKLEEEAKEKSKDTKEKSKDTKEKLKDTKEKSKDTKEALSDPLTSRIKVIVKTDNKENGSTLWENADETTEDCDLDDFVSEYDREFQLENKVKSSEELVDQNKKQTKNMEIQVEEPSSSGDVTVVAANIAKNSSTEDTFKKPTELVEADSSKKSDGSLTPQESTTKSDEPSEQNILAHFFENLLKSKNKKDKKTALFSLIETFSDSFESKEIQKIRKIIKVDEDDDDQDSEEEEKETISTPEKKEEPKENSQGTIVSISSTQDEQAVVGSTTKELPPNNEKEAESTESVTSVEPSNKTDTQINEITKSTEESEKPSIEESKSEESLDQINEPGVNEALEPGVNETLEPGLNDALEPVMVSVGERIKNRKRNSTPAKPRKKGKTELDLLHEDIQDMFIRDGVLTATGKRMCRILKDDPTVLSVSSATSSEQSKKVRKKPGPKSKVKEEVHNSMKDMRIIIKKMPDEVMSVSTSSTRQLRSRTRYSSYAESDDDQKKDQDATHQLRSRNPLNYAEADDDSQKADDTSITHPDDNESMKSEMEGDVSSESEEEEDTKSQTSDGVPKPRVMRRRRGAKWASGIIPKNKKKKNLSKSLENSPVPSRAPSPSPMEIEFDKLMEPDKEYYYDYTNKGKLKCKLCNYAGHLLTGHYLKEHPQSEVMCSRLAPDVATEAIKDFAVNGKKYESLTDLKMSTKYHYQCRVCGFTSTTSPIFFYEHITTHTGEYRHQCGICEYYAVTGKTIAGHFNTAHPNQEKKAIKRTYTLAIVFGYLCSECNFVQLKEKSVEDHVNIFHLGGKPVIHKINMSTILDPIFNATDEPISAITEKISEVPTENETADDVGKNETSQSLKEKQAVDASPRVDENKIEDQSKEKESPAPGFKKKPGPKSKTMPKSKTVPQLIQEPENTTTEVVATPVTKVGKRAGPKSKTQKQKRSTSVEQSTDDESVRSTQKQLSTTPSETSLQEKDETVKEAPTRKRRRSLDKLISEDSGDDLDTIITLSSRSSRAAKEKATAKLKTLMESNEGLSTRKRSDTDLTRQEKEKNRTSEGEGANKKDEAATKETPKENDVSHDIPNEQPLEDKQPPEDKKKSSVNKDLNVFTCKTDIVEEDAKKIEEDRLRKMEELNKSIGSRTSKLDFVDKLSDRLNNEQANENQNINIKEEPKDDLPIANTVVSRSATPTMPVLEKEIITPVPLTTTSPVTKINKSPAVSKKPILEDDSPVPQSSITFRQNKPNSLFSNIIEKLQGKISEAATQQQSSTPISSPANEDSSISSPLAKAPEVLISIGDLVSATRKDNEIIYSCHANNCYVATKDKMVFQLHCKFGHKDLSLTSSLCEKCGIVIETTPDTSLLENLYDHLVFAHSDCISKVASLRMRRLSGDKLSVKQEVAEKPSNKKAPAKPPQDFEAEIDRQLVLAAAPPTEEPTLASVTTPIPVTASIKTSENLPSVTMPENPKLQNAEPAASEATLELAEDNPFSFKIANVMSLAETSESEDHTPKTSPDKNTPKIQELTGENPVPPLTLINNSKQQTHFVVKEAKLSSAELSRPRKTLKILQKFIDTPNDLYKCPHFYCMFTTNIRRFIERHLKAHKSDNDGMVACVYCDMKTPWEHVPMHIDIRHANCRFVCKYCLYRACVKEYVFLHQEQFHQNEEFLVMSLPPRTSRKFSVADTKIDYKNVCEPFKCVCVDDQQKVKEYLFESEFINHLNTVHPNVMVACGYPGCSHKLKSSVALNHWAMFHGVCTYQCSYCKTSSKEVTRIYSHFAQMHPNSPPNILVRVHDNLPQERELGYSKEAFAKLTHIKKVPQNLLSLLGKRNQKSLKLLHCNPTGTTEDSSLSNAENLSEGTSSPTPSSLILPTLPSVQTVPVTHSQQPKILISQPNIQFLVASTTGKTETLYIVPASMVSPNQSVTSMAPISKVVAQTTTATKSASGRAGESVEMAHLVPSSSLSPVSTINPPKELWKIGEVALRPIGQTTESTITTPSSSHATIAALSRSLPPTVVTRSSPLPQKSLIKLANKEKKLLLPPIPSTVTIKPVSTESSTSKNIEPTDSASGLASEDASSQDSGSIGLSEDDILQSAIQSILEADDFSENSTFSEENLPKNNAQNSSRLDRYSPVDRTAPPPLVYTNSPKSNKTAIAVKSGSPAPNTTVNQEQHECSVELVAPVEHVDVSGNVPDSSLLSEDVDPLTMESNEDSNLDGPMFDDINVGMDSPPEDPLTITPTFNSEDPLNVNDSVAVDPLQVEEIPTDDSTNQSSSEGGQDPLKISAMRRSVSLVSNSDDESDSSSSEKGKKRGLMGYQLFRCASCNLSFSNIQTFKSHITNAVNCKKTTGSRQYLCVHCDKTLKTPQRLVDHIQTHGVQRFTCSLCNEKFSTAPIAKLHMKNRHNIPQTNLMPVNPDRSNMDVDAFMVKPGQASQPMVKAGEAASESPKLAGEDGVYNPDQIDSIPIRQIFSSNVKCGKCNYQTKVRVNIIRHLQMHLEEKLVPDSAPVNPVPCLEKNEKMFDKMINLAASSITTGRMGGGNQDKEKEEEKFPEFVPTHRRFVCSAQGCSYLCPEEGNLKHHLMALHSDDSEFTCAHCKKKIEATDPESVIKHFKLHGLHLYKCSYCSFVHHLKHKVERHVSDGHLDAVVKVITLRSMESEPVDYGNTDEETTPQPAPVTTSKFKPWRCCMCKVKSHSKEDMQYHILNRHDVDTQYKCTLCAFKNDDENSFKEHFKEKHPSHDIDIICVYKKVEEEQPKEDPKTTPFDTTPLWQRDKPRVRHIRGILFDESSPQPAKSPKKQSKTFAVPASKVSSPSSTTSPATTSANKNLFDCIDAVARGTAETLHTVTKATKAKNSTEESSTVPEETEALGEKKDDKKIVAEEKEVPSLKKIVPAKKAVPSLKKIVPEKVVPTLKKIVPEKVVPTLKKIVPEEKQVVPSLKEIVPEEKVVPSEKNEAPESLDNANDDVVEIKQPLSIIVIDSDDSDSEFVPESGKDETPKSEKDEKPKLKEKDNKAKPVAKNKRQKRSSTTDLLHEAVKMAKIEEPEDEVASMVTNCRQDHLISVYGIFGGPHNKQWKCPKCHQFKSKRVGDFIFHIYKDFNVYRYKCKACSDLSITYKYMLDHITLHPGFTEDIIETLPPNVKLETWIHMVIRTQTLTILKNSPLMTKRPVVGHTDITCYFCNENRFQSNLDAVKTCQFWNGFCHYSPGKQYRDGSRSYFIKQCNFCRCNNKFMSMTDCCEHMLYHWVMMPYQCQHCPSEFYTVFDLKHHHKIEHPDLKPYFEPKGPTLSRALQCIENIKKRPLTKPSPEAPPKKKLKTDTTKDVKEVKTSGTVVNTPKLKGSAAASPAISPIPSTSTEAVINVEDDDDDLVIVTKTDEVVPNEDEVFACEACAFMADTEILINKHLWAVHGISTKKFHTLSKKMAETSSPQDMACNICDAVFPELKLRRHFLDNHLEKHTYAPYRFKCLICSNRFLTVPKMKMHFVRAHPLDTLRYHAVASPSKPSVSAKTRLYSCTLCSYTNTGTQISAIKVHVRGHLRALVCNPCGQRFRYHKEIQAHHTKTHPELTLSVTTLEEVEKEFEATVRKISNRSILVSDMEETKQSVVEIQDAKQPTFPIPIKNYARKSTSAAFTSPAKPSLEEEEEYSYYGAPQEPCDITNIVTTFELDGLEYTTTAEQMMKMFNMETFVDVSDCTVSIIPADDS